VALWQNRRLAREIASSPVRGKLSSMAATPEKAFFITTTTHSDDPGVAIPLAVRTLPRTIFGRPRQRDMLLPRPIEESWPRNRRRSQSLGQRRRFLQKAPQAQDQCCQAAPRDNGIAN